MSNREISRKEMVRSASTASFRAVEQAKSNNIAYTSQQGRRIVKHHPNGRTENLGELPKAYVVAEKKRYQIK